MITPPQRPEAWGLPITGPLHPAEGMPTNSSEKEDKNGLSQSQGSGGVLRTVDEGQVQG